MTAMTAHEVIVGGQTIAVGQEFDTYFHRSWRGRKLYLIARSDTGMIIMPENGSRIYADAVNADIIHARCMLLKTCTTSRNTMFAVARPLSWRVIC